MMLITISHTHTCIHTQDHETAIMYRLQEVVVERMSSLLAVMELSAELDWYEMFLSALYWSEFSSCFIQCYFIGTIR